LSMTHGKELRYLVPSLKEGSKRVSGGEKARFHRLFHERKKGKKGGLTT